MVEMNINEMSSVIKARAYSEDDKNTINAAAYLALCNIQIGCSDTIPICVMDSYCQTTLVRKLYTYGAGSAMIISVFGINYLLYKSGLITLYVGPKLW